MKMTYGETHTHIHSYNILYIKSVSLCDKSHLFPKGSEKDQPPLKYGLCTHTRSRSRSLTHTHTHTQTPTHTPTTRTHTLSHNTPTPTPTHPTRPNTHMHKRIKESSIGRTA